MFLSYTCFSLSFSLPSSLSLESINLKIIFFYNYKPTFKKDFIYLFLERGGRREEEREISTCGCLSHAPYWGPGPQPRHVP